jgi:hypothetical protein
VLARVFPVGNSREHLIDPLPRASVDGSVRTLAATGPKQQSSHFTRVHRVMLADVTLPDAEQGDDRYLRQRTSFGQG